MAGRAKRPRRVSDSISRTSKRNKNNAIIPARKWAGVKGDRMGQP